MFGIDKAIDEFHKERLYGKKPKVPERIEQYNIEDEKLEGLIRTVKVLYQDITDKLNEIIKYLEWLDK